MAGRIKTQIVLLSINFNYLWFPQVQICSLGRLTQKQTLSACSCTPTIQGHGILEFLAIGSPSCWHVPCSGKAMEHCAAQQTQARLSVITCIWLWFPEMGAPISTSSLTPVLRNTMRSDKMSTGDCSFMLLPTGYWVGMAEPKFKLKFDSHAFSVLLTIFFLRGVLARGFHICLPGVRHLPNLFLVQ